MIRSSGTMFKSPELANKLDQFRTCPGKKTDPKLVSSLRDLQREGAAEDCLGLVNVQRT